MEHPWMPYILKFLSLTWTEKNILKALYAIKIIVFVKKQIPLRQEAGKK